MENNIGEIKRRQKKTKHDKNCNGETDDVLSEIQYLWSSSCPGYRQKSLELSKPTSNAAERNPNKQLTYTKGGQSKSDNGAEFHFKLATLLLLRALSTSDDFNIASERKTAGKFDDLEVQIAGTHRLYQFKRKEKADHKITVGDLKRIKKDAQFGLKTYFESYMKNIDNITSNGNDVEFVIFTNAGLEENLLQHFEDTGKDKLLDMKSLFDFKKKFKTEPKLLKLKKNCPFQTEILAFLTENTEADHKSANFFLDKLVLAVNQPDVSDLQEIIENTLVDHGCTNSFAATDLKEKIREWIREENGTPLDRERGQKMLQEIKQNISKSFIDKLTLNYSAQLKEKKLLFHNTLAGLELFLKDDKKTTLLVKTQVPNLSAIKILQTLDKIQYNRDSFIFSTLDKLQESSEFVLDAFQLSKILIIEFPEANCKMENLFASELSNLIVKNQTKKLILICSGKNRDNMQLVFANKSQEIQDEEISFNDLSEESQKMLLQSKTVLFQGYPTCLEKSLTEFIDPDILFRIVSNDELEIGGKLADLGEVPNYYVDRLFQRIRLDESLLEDKKLKIIYGDEVSDLSDIDSDQDIVLISNSDDDFVKLCSQHKEKNIHLITEPKQYDRFCIWKRSNSLNLEKIRKYRIYKKNDMFGRLEEHKIGTLEICGNKIETGNKIVIIAAPPGMGKSTVVTKLATEFKKSNNSFWVMRINLIDCSQLFDDQKKQFDLEEAKQFLNKLIVSTAKEHTQTLEWKWFDHCFNNNKLIIFFDGFDEISTVYNEKVIELLKALKNSKIYRMVVTTRSYNNILNELEDQLSTFSYSFEPFKGYDKYNFLFNFLANSNLNIEPDQLDEYTNSLIARFSFDRLSFDTNKSWVGFFDSPLQMKMVAEVFVNAKLKDTNLRDILLTNVKDEIDLAELYKLFFCYLFEKIYIEEKDSDRFANRFKHNYEIWSKNERQEIIENCKKLALYSLFGKEEFEKYLPGELTTLQTLIDEIKKGEHKMGIIERVVDDKPIFVHRTYAEYFVALFLVSVGEKSNIENDIPDEILNTGMINKFLVSLMAQNEKYKEKFPIHAAILRSDGNTLKSLLSESSDLDLNERDSFFLKSSLECVAHFEIWNMLDLLIQNVKQIPTTLQSCVQQSLRIVLEKDLLDVYKMLEQTYLNSMKITTIYADHGKDYYEYMFSNDTCLNNYNNETSNSNKKNNFFLFALDKCSNRIMKHLLDSNGHMLDNLIKEPRVNLLHRAVKSGSKDTVKLILDTGKVDINVKNSKGETPLQVAVKDGITDMVKYLLTFKMVDFVILNKEEENLLQIAVKNNYYPIFQCLLNTKRFEVLTTDRNGNNLIHLINSGYRLKPQQIYQDVSLLNYLINTLNIDANLKNYLNETPLMLAGRYGYLEFLKVLHKSLSIDKVKSCILHYITHCIDENHALKCAKYAVEIIKVDPNNQDINGNTALHLAIESRMIYFATYLIDLPEVKIDIQNDDGHTALHLAAAHGPLKIVILLVEKKKVNKTKDGLTAMNLAALGGKHLIKKYEFDLTAKDSNDNTTFRYAVQGGDAKIVRFLGDTNEFDDDLKLNGENYLQIATKKSHLEIVKYLIEEKKIDTNTIDSDGKTLLHLSVSEKKESIATLRYLISRCNIDINAKNYYGDTLLHRCFQFEKRCFWNLAFLIENVAVDVNIQDRKGHTALHLAAKRGAFDEVKLLIEDRKADTNLKTKDGKTTLHFAALNGYLDVLKYLLATKLFDINAKDSNDKTIFHYAVQGGNPYAVKYLASTGNFDSDIQINGEQYLRDVTMQCNLDLIRFFIETINVNANKIFSDGETLLHSVATFSARFLMPKQLECLKYLVEKVKVPVDIQDKNRLTALHLVVENKYSRLDAVQYLVQPKYAVTNIKNLNGQTAYDIAVELGKTEIASFLRKITAMN